MIFLHKSFKLIASQVATHSADEQFTSTPAVSLARVQGIGAQILPQFWNGAAHKVTGLDAEELAMGQIRFQWELVHNAELFVVGHELSHIIMRGSRHAQLPTSFSRNNFLSASQQAAWEEECNADLISLMMCIRSSEAPERVISAVELFFITLSALSKYYQAQHHRPADNEQTHPPAAFRLQVVRQFVSQSYGQSALAVGRELESISQSVFGNSFGNTRLSDW
jgi:hypothetical protein